MSANQFPVPTERDILVLLNGTSPVDYEIAYGGQYVALIVAKVGGGAVGTQSLQLQVYAGPEDADPTLAANAAYWINSGAALVVGTPLAISLGHRTRVRLTPAGAATGTGAFLTLKRIPQ